MDRESFEDSRKDACEKEGERLFYSCYYLFLLQNFNTVGNNM